MQISRQSWLNYIERLSRLNKTAADKMKAYININGLDNENLIEYAYGIATKYGEGSAALAAEMYDLTAQLSGVTLDAAVPANTAEYEEVAKAINGTKKTRNVDLVSNAVGRLVKQAGADTTIKNAIRDRAEWAWIPSGDTCVFCLTLASRGWQDASKALLKGDHASHIHANCDCTFAIRFNKDTEYEGYDPDKYLEMYNNAEGGTSKEKINSLRREYYQQNKDKINAQKRALYHKKTGNLSTDEYARAVELWNKLDEIVIPERNHVIEEFDNWLTPEEKSHCIVSKEIDNYRYYAVTKGHNEYKIYKKEPVTKGIDWLDDVLTEVVGPDWRKYDK